MDPDMLKYTCKLQSELYDIPFNVYATDNSLELGEVDFILKTSPDLFKSFLLQQEIDYVVVNDFLLLGYVRVADSPYYIVVGPTRITDTDEEKVSSVMAMLTSRSIPADRAELDIFFSNVKIMSVSTMAHILCLLHCLINGKQMATDELIGKRFENVLADQTNKDMLNREKNSLYFEERRANQEEFEKEAVFFIQQGNFERANEKLQSFSANMGKLGPNALRHYKNACIILNALALRAAIRGGADSETCFALGEIYIQKIEACGNIETLSQLAGNLVREYCGRVAKVNRYLTPHDDINQAIHFVLKNVHKRLLVQEIADAVYLSPQYLSVKFHKTTNDTLPGFINRMKTEKAKELLVLTDLPISEISEYLSFSSQSYFQNIFKKHAGTTPLRFRRDNRGSVLL